MWTFNKVGNLSLFQSALTIRIKSTFEDVFIENLMDFIFVYNGRIVLGCFGRKKWKKDRKC